MSEQLIEQIAERGVFRPRGNFGQLAVDHVAFDELLGARNHEAAALAGVAAEEPVGVVGPRGAGKSSLIAYVCANLPANDLALRVPVTGADDPTNVSTVAAVALSQALDDIDLERYQRDALARARADQDTAVTSPGGLRDATLGGGLIPAQVHAELASLRQELVTNRLAADRLQGLDRLITILVARGVRPVFVLEDTEAAVGGADRAEVAEAFLAGPVKAFVSEVEAPCLIAIQTAFERAATFSQIAAEMRVITIPTLDEPVARDALNAIISNRLSQYEATEQPQDILADEALGELVGFYAETERSLRFTLAALQTAAEYAADMRAAAITAGHTSAALTDWRARIST
jgi:hypothetical protein